MYSLVPYPKAGTVVWVIGYQVPVTPETILSESVKLMLGVKVMEEAVLLYQVVIIFSPKENVLVGPVTP